MRFYIPDFHVLYGFHYPNDKKFRNHFYLSHYLNISRVIIGESIKKALDSLTQKVRFGFKNPKDDATVNCKLNVMHESVVICFDDA